MLRQLFHGLAFLTSVVATTSAANAQPIPFGGAPRALCVTDPYGTPYCSWLGSPVAFNSYFYFSPYGGYSSGYSSATNGFYLGGVPAVASATTPEWIVQRTSVFPIGSYSPWLSYPGASLPLMPPRFGIKSPTASPIAARETGTSSTRSRLIQQVNAIQEIEGDPQDSLLELGDRWLREGRPVDAYLQYLKAQRDADDHGKVLFRQALALLAMKRYSHAVAKFQQGSRFELDDSRHRAWLDNVYGESAKARMSDSLAHVEHWTNADPRDPNRLFLMSIVLQLNDEVASQR